MSGYGRQSNFTKENSQCVLFFLLLFKFIVFHIWESTTKAYNYIRLRDYTNSDFYQVLL